jgi:hypothetical protein
VPRVRDYVDDDPYDSSARPPRRRSAGRGRGDTTSALVESAEPDLGADDFDSGGTAPGQRRRDRDVGRRRHLDAAADPFDDAEWEDEEPGPEASRRGYKPRLADGSESFKCGHCKAFIGPTVSGGRHRNHCPLCLYSRHVDNRRMGDRASACRSLMAPIGVFYRPKGEQVVVHRCLGCGFERHNRVAADDNLLLLAELPEVPPRLRGGASPGEEGGSAGGTGWDEEE